MSTTTKHHETQITASPELPTIEITREFDAPPEKVFRAHTDPDLLIRWLGPRELRMQINKFDARTGGAYQYTHTDQDGNEYRFHGSFHEVRPSERIVQTFTFEGFPNEVSLEKALFTDLGGRTRLSVVSLMGSFEARDGMLASDMEWGVREGYEQLDELLAE